LNLFDGTLNNNVRIESLKKFHELFTAKIKNFIDVYSKIIKILNTMTNNPNNNILWKLKSAVDAWDEKKINGENVQVVHSNMHL
jgi:hypothetical protein